MIGQAHRSKKKLHRNTDRDPHLDLKPWIWLGSWTRSPPKSNRLDLWHALHPQKNSSKSVHNLLRYAAKCQLTPLSPNGKESWKMIQYPRKNPDRHQKQCVTRTCHVLSTCQVWWRYVTAVVFVLSCWHTYAHTRTEPVIALLMPGDYVGVSKAVITTAIRLRHGYDPTYRARLFAFDAIRREQKIHMSIFRRSRVVVVSQSNRNCDIGLTNVNLVHSSRRRERWQALCLWRWYCAWAQQTNNAGPHPTRRQNTHYVNR